MQDRLGLISVSAETRGQDLVVSPVQAGYEPRSSPGSLARAGRGATTRMAIKPRSKLCRWLAEDYRWKNMEEFASFHLAGVRFVRSGTGREVKCAEDVHLGSKQCLQPTCRESSYVVKHVPAGGVGFVFAPGSWSYVLYVISF